MNPINTLLTALGALTAVYIGGWSTAVLGARRIGARAKPDNPATDARFPITGVIRSIDANPDGAAVANIEKK